jgi:crossover junction endodeoxyribonuclease RusA
MNNKIKLPYPISANRYWRTFRNRTVVSKEAGAYKKQVALLAMVANVKVSGKQVEVSITLLPRLTKSGVASLVVIDLDNALKVSLDALIGVAYIDDKQVRVIHARYGDPVKDGGVVVEVKEL